MLKKIFKLIILISILFLSLFLLNYQKVTFTKTKEVFKNKDKEKSVKLTLVGDFLFESPYYESIKMGDSLDTYFKRVKHYFKEDDISIGNMEVVIGNDTLPISGDGYNFCAPKYIGDLMNTLDLEVLSTANNHAFDRGIAGINSSLDYFKENTDILTVGTYNDDTLNHDVILEKNNLKFGFLAYTYGTNQKPNAEDEKYISYYKDREKLKEEVENLRKKVDVLIVIMHWGKEFSYNENEEQQDMANYLNSLKVDIIVGSHSHNISPIKWVGSDYKTLVFYSLGNFTSSDNDISRTGEEYDNAYQFGLLANLLITKLDKTVEINNIKTIPIINYYDSNMRNFELIPLDEYDDNYETKHYRYKNNFTKDFVKTRYEKVIAEDFR